MIAGVQVANVFTYTQSINQSTKQSVGRLVACPSHLFAVTRPTRFAGRRAGGRELRVGYVSLAGPLWAGGRYTALASIQAHS